jgi:nucleoside-diphosphate-sugar epimerase
LKKKGLRGVSVRIKLLIYKSLSGFSHREKMKLFITGSASFIGQEVLKLCRQNGIEVYGVDLVDSGHPDCSIADINSPKISEYIPTGVDAIIHLAALSRDGDCRDQALKCFDANVMGTLNLIEAAKSKQVKQFIFASSEWVYDSFEDRVFKTEDSLINISNHDSEYALSKIVSEANLKQKFKHGFCPVTVLRFGIIYGPREQNWSAVEAIFNSVATQDEVSIGSLKTGRHFIHVSDIASAILAAVGMIGYEILNIQGKKLITLRDIIETSKELVGKNPRIIEKNPDKISLRMVSNKKAKDLINWEARIGLKKGLRTVSEFLDYEPIC